MRWIVLIFDWIPFIWNVLFSFLTYMYLHAECRWWNNSTIANLLLLVGCGYLSINSYNFSKITKFKLFNDKKLYSSRPRKRRRKDSVQNEKRSNVKFMELDSPEDIQNGFILKDDGRNCTLIPAVSIIRNNIFYMHGRIWFFVCTEHKNH